MTTDPSWTVAVDDFFVLFSVIESALFEAYSSAYVLYIDFYALGAELALGPASVPTGGVFSNTITVTLISPPVSAIPLPGTLPLFLTGLGALGLLGWRRKRKAASA